MALVGRPVTKKFGRKLYLGVIEYFIKKENWYHVRYEDGDTEDILASEAEAIVKPLQEPSKQAKSRSDERAAPRITKRISLNQDKPETPKQTHAPARANDEKEPSKQAKNRSDERAAPRITKRISLNQDKPVTPKQTHAPARANGEKSPMAKGKRAKPDSKGSGASESAKKGKFQDSSRWRIDGVSDKEAHELIKACISEFNKLRVEAIELEKARVEERKAADQRGEGAGKKTSQRPDLVAIRMLKAANQHIGEGKRVGAIAGVPVGFKFMSRAEMVVCGAHSQHMAGIDYISGQAEEKANVCVALVHGTDYEDNNDSQAQSGELVYTGQGGNDLLHSRQQIADQILERGNKALVMNIEAKVPVRMFFKNKDKGSYTNVSLTYDGLWDVVEYWREKGKSGFHVFKYRLKRQSGQPAYSFKTIAEEQEEVAKERERKRLLKEEETQSKIELQAAIREAKRAEKAASQSPKPPKVKAPGVEDDIPSSASTTELRRTSRVGKSSAKKRASEQEAAEEGSDEVQHAAKKHQPVPAQTAPRSVVLVEDLDLPGARNTTLPLSDAPCSADACQVSQFLCTFRGLLRCMARGEEVNVSNVNLPASDWTGIPHNLAELERYLHDTELVAQVYLAVIPLALSAIAWTASIRGDSSLLNRVDTWTSLLTAHTWPEVVRRLANRVPSPDTPSGEDLAALEQVGKGDVDKMCMPDCHAAALRWLSDLALASPEAHLALDMRIEGAEERAKQHREENKKGIIRMTQAIADAKENVVCTLESLPAPTAVPPNCTDLEEMRQLQREAKAYAQRESDRKMELIRKVREVTQAIVSEEDADREARSASLQQTLASVEFQIRIENLGNDRHFRSYWWLPAANLVLCEGECSDQGSGVSSARQLRTRSEISTFVKALNPSGIREQALQQALETRTGMLDEEVSGSDDAKEEKCAKVDGDSHTTTRRLVQEAALGLVGWASEVSRKLVGMKTKGRPAAVRVSAAGVSSVPELKELLIMVEEAIRVKLEECNGPVVELGGTDAVPADDCDKASQDSDASESLDPNQGDDSCPKRPAVELDSLSLEGTSLRKRQGNFMNLRKNMNLWNDTAERAAWLEDVSKASSLAALMYCNGLLARRIAAAHKLKAYVAHPLWDRLACLDQKATGNELGNEDPEAPVFSVEKILNRRQVKRSGSGQFEYLVKWLGYPFSEASWEPEANLGNAKAAIRDYQKSLAV